MTPPRNCPTDAKARFIRFFEKESAPCRLPDHHHDMFSKIKEIPESARRTVSIFDAHVHFDADGNHLGDEDGGFGRFVPARTAKPRQGKS